MDDFALAYPMYKLSPRKAEILTAELNRFRPKNILEIGTFFGYSALHIIQHMPVDANFISIEGNEENYDVAKFVINRAFGNREVIRRVQLIRGVSYEVLPILRNMNHFDFLFFDHDKDNYLPDLQYCEMNRLLNDERCEIIADNVIYPDVLRPFLSYLNINDAPDDKENTIGEIESENPSRPWSGRLEYAPFERIGFETKFTQVPDAMSVAVYYKPHQSTL
jgi:predicted O-methyltransferase YrrM